MPSTQAIVIAIAIAIATEGNVCIAQELGAMRRTQEDAVADKKKDLNSCGSGTGHQAFAPI